MRVNLIWFRRDLRLDDNEAVTVATGTGAPVLPFFIVDPQFYQETVTCSHRNRFLFAALADLDRALRARGSQLQLLSGNAVIVFQHLIRNLQQQGIRPQLFYNWDVQTTYGIDRDRQIEGFCQEQKIPLQRGRNNFIQWERNARDRWRDEYYAYLREPLFVVPEQLQWPQLSLDNLPTLDIDTLWHRYNNHWHGGSQFVIGGASQAHTTLNSFLKYRCQGYHWKLSRPWEAQHGGSSHLSAHISFGCISTRQIYQAVKARAAELPAKSKLAFALRNFRDRLRWRDSALQRYYHRPELAHQNQYSEFDTWYTPDTLSPEKQELFAAWQEGMTGFPMVDASMRQLQTLGWMNFRMRALCATFLTINCGISWHHGATHYMRYLIDGDLAIDHWQWQAQAGVTNPLSATFRIYNPTKNLQDKDAQLQFVREWLPELRGYELSEILAGQNLNEGYYPPPILDWSATRRQHGKIVSDLRKATRKRLQKERGPEWVGARKIKDASEKYREARERQHRDTQPGQTPPLWISQSSTRPS